MKVNFYATLRQHTGGKTVELPLEEGATVRELLAAVVDRFPPVGTVLLDEGGALRGHVHIFVSGRDTPYLERALDTVLASGDTIDIFPAVAGG